MNYIDLRSDTVTMPTGEMREAMARAAVGDDVFRDDPTVNELEAMAAELLGKEAALFVTSGTQGNTAAVMTHTRRGDAVVMGRDCHIATHENGSYAMLSGVSPSFPEDDGDVLRPESVEALLVGEDYDVHVPPVGLLCVENALANGNVAPVENMAALYRLAHERGIPVHLDGARLFNAAAYLGADVKELTRNCDSVMCCLSKGLCAPVGSILAGEREFIRRARRTRKLLGGGMRQAGVLAAAGIVALTKMKDRLADDHENARYLASQLAGIPGVRIDVAAVRINMVFFSVDWADPVVAAFPGMMLRRGIKVLAGRDMRFVTNHGVSRADCDIVIAAIREALDEAAHD